MNLHARSWRNFAMASLALGPVAFAQQTVQEGSLEPIRQLVSPATMEWNELVQLQASLPEQAWSMEWTPGPMLDAPALEAQSHPELALPNSPNDVEALVPAGCPGFVSEPPLSKDFTSQADVPDGGGFSYIPPNVAGSVGPNHLMTMLNNKVLVQDRLGATVQSLDTLVFWSPLAPTAVTYCRVHYDGVSDRWIATGRGGTGGTMIVMFAISDTDDPTGSWDFYSTAADPGATTFPDWLVMGYNATWVALTANMFTVAGGAASGTRLYTFDMAAALAGGPVTVTTFPSNFWQVATGTGVAASGFSLHPARYFDSSIADLWVLNNGFTSGGGVNNVFQMCRITGTGPAPSIAVTPGSTFAPAATSSLFQVVTNYSNTQRAITQVSEARFITPFSTRLASVAVRNGRIWLAHSCGLPGPANNGSPASNGFAWYELNPAAFPAPIAQFSHVTDGTNTMAAYPSLAVNCANDVVVGFSRSSSAKHPESAYTVRLGTDAANFMGPTRLLKAGLSTYWKNFGVGTFAQWGLYSSSSVDPVDDQTLWTIQEHAAQRVGVADNDSRWGTWWGRIGSCGQPTIDDEPISQALCEGDPVTFTVAATASHPPIQYQWRKDGVPLVGETGTSFSIGSTVAGDAGVYDVLVDDGCGSTLSVPATLTVDTPATITVQPNDANLCAGIPLTLSVTASAPVTYQWFKDGDPILGATDSTLSFTPVQLSDAGTYEVLIENACGSELSTSVSVFVRPQPLITSQPTSQEVLPGSTVVFSVRAQRPPSPPGTPTVLTYQWRKDGVPLATGGKKRDLTLFDVDPADEGVYDCVVTARCSIVSDPASLTVLTGPKPKHVTEPVQPLF